MSNTIDQRVVEMQFDNRNFERNVSTTMSTLDKLKQSLKMSGASKGFENISTAANGVNMSGLGSAVEAVGAKFSAMSVIGITALANITNSAINTGKQLVKSLSIDQITAGWSKFSSKTSSVATLVAQGNALEDVNSQLDRLNWFTDETSYNFTDMVSNIAKFTATGKGLNESVTAMEGIANWAALSGQNAQTASHAMYQLSQAMGAGVMRKEDYKSIQNASMDTEEFRRKCLEAGVALGTLKDNGDGTYQSLVEGAKSSAFEQSQFAEHLTQDMWLTSDVMMKVFTDYSSAVNAIYEVTEEKGMLASEVLDQIHTRADELKTGVMTDEEAINAAIKDLGYTTEDGALLFDAFGVKAFEAAQKARTWGDALDSVKDAVSTGWMNTFEIIFGNAEEATELFTDLANSMWDVFASGGEARNEMLKGWKELGGRDDLIEGFWNMWEGFFGDGDKYLGLLGSLKEAFREVFPPMTSERLASITEGFKNLTEKLKPSAETLDKLKRAFKGVFSIFDMGKKAISAILKPIGQLFGSEGFGSLGDFLLTTAANIGDFFTALNEGFETTKISEVLSKITSGISDFLKGIFDGLGGFSGIFSSIGDTICNVASKIWGAVTKVFGWIKENISAGDIFAGLAGGGIFAAAKKFSGLVDKIKDTFSSLFDKKDDGVKTKFSDILDSIHNSLESFTSGIKVASLIGIAAAVTLLSSSFKKISELDGTGIAKSLLTIGASLAMMMKALNSMPKNKAFATDFFGMSESTNLIKSGAALILMAESIKLLADAIVKLSELSLKEIGKGLIAVGGGMTVLALGLKTLNNVNIPLRTSIAMLALAESCKILGDAFTKFSGFSWGEIARGLVAMGGALGELVAAMAVLQKFGGFSDIFSSLGILITVKSLGDLADSLKSFGDMQWDEIGRGLTAMGGALAELTVVLATLSKVSTISLGGNVSGGIIGMFSNKLFGKGGASISGSGGFSAQISGLSNIFSAGAIWVVIQGLSKLADSLKSFGDMQWDEIGRGLSGMGGALIEVGAVTGALGKFVGFSSIFGSGAILLTIQGLADLADAFKQFGGMSWDEIDRGFSGMGDALAEVTLMTGALGKFAGFSGILGSGAILLAVQGLDDLANAFKKFGEMSWGEIGRGLAGMGGALVELGAVTGALGYLTNFAGLLGAGTILVAVKGLDDLANAFKKFGEMNWGEIGRGFVAMGAALGEIAVGGLLNTLSIIGASSISKMAAPLGTLADSLKKWSDVKVPIGLGAQLVILARGVEAFTFGGLGALTIVGISNSLGTLADSVKKWSDVKVPIGLGAQLALLAAGVTSFTLGGLGALAISEVAAPLGTLADSVKAWDGVSVPSNLGDDLSSLAKGVRSFTFDGLGAVAINQVADPLGVLADSVKAWKNVKVPTNLGTDLSSLAKGVRSFTFAFAGGWSIDAVNGPLESLADSVKAWDGVKVPSGIEEDLTGLANGVMAFGAAFVGGWSIGAVDGPLASLADSVRAWEGVTVPSGLEEDLTSLANGVMAFGAAFVGGWSIDAVDGPLASLADSVKAWDGVSVPSNLGDDLSSLAKGVRSFTFDGFGASSLDTVAAPLGVLADSVKAWKDVSVPSNLGDDLGSLAKGISKFTLKGWGADNISKVAAPLGVLADSARNWSDVKVPDTLGTQLESLASGIKEFNIKGNGADNITKISDSLGTLADSVKNWSDVSIPDDLGDKLESLGKGVAAFGFEGTGENTLASSASAIGTLAVSIKKWTGVSIPETLGDQLVSLAKGVKEFSFEGADSNTLAASAPAIGTLATSIKKWTGVTIPKTLGDQLTSLAKGVEAFNFEGDAENALSSAAPAIGDLAVSIKKWSNLSIPERLSSQLVTLAAGVKAFNFEGSDSNALATVAPAIGDLAASVKKWTGVTVPKDLGTQLTTLAEGVGSFSFEGADNNTLATAAPAIGTLAASIKKWTGLTVPENLGSQLESLASGVGAFSFEGADNNTLATAAPAIGTLAASVKKWKDITIPDTLGNQLTTLAAGVEAFSYDGAADSASALTTVAPSIGVLADSIRQWQGVTIPDDLGSQLETLASGIGAFNFDEGVNNILTTVAPSIGTLADSIKNWSDVTIPETLTGDQLTNLAKGIAAFSFEGADNNALATTAPAIGVLADSVAKWSKLTIPETLTGDQLTNLAKGIAAFSFDGAENNTLTTVAPAIGVLADSVSKWTKLTIPETLTGDQLTNLAKGVEAFTFDEAENNTLATVAPAIGVLADSVAKWTKLTIPETLTGDQLTNLAKGVEAFTFDDAGNNALTTVAPAIGVLADSVAKWTTLTIPETLTGDQLTNLAKGVEAFTFDGTLSLDSAATGIGNMADSVAKWKSVTIPETLTGGQLTSLAEGIEAFIFTGSLSLDSAATGIGNMADSIAKWKAVEIPDSLSGDLQNLAEGVSAFNGMSAMPSGATALSNIHSAASLLAGIQFKTISSGLDSLKTSLSDFGSVGSSVSGVGQTIVDNIVTPIQDAIPVISAAADQLADAIAAGFSAKGSAISTAARTLVTNAASTVSSKASSFRTAGSKLGSALAAGIRSQASGVSSAASGAASSAVSGARGAYSGMYSAGVYLGTGLINGIKSQKQAAYDAGYDLGKKAVEGEKAGQDSESPSKATIKAGKWLGEGLIIGMQRISQSVYNSGESMGQNAVDATTSAMTDMLNAINSDVDAQPTIKPIVDLSDVKTGVNAISGMFDSGPSVGVMANIKAINSSMNRRSQNGSNGEVVSAINKLRDKLDNVGNTYYAIDGITYDDGSAVSDAIGTLIRYAKIEGRV